MLSLQGEIINLRALEPEDLELLFNIENNKEFWEISTTITPYSKFILRQYLENSHRDIYDVKQLRLVICKAADNEPVGLIDLFDFDPRHKRAAIGILIENGQDRGKGYGAEALALLCEYCFQQLDLHQLVANVGADNIPSQKLFEKAGFLLVGKKKDWNLINGKFKDELLYQLIEHVH